ncbi:MAG TPA: bifunctional riboflavin kinase/FAD synthetase [Ktedonobacteraceae bacterium]|nr:bifunctional riboflavin kinase/FAD synthetase [Ktedonobacteraceae bacterium]
MELTTTLSPEQPIAITIGNFDGIHRGHQRLLYELGEAARETGSAPVMVTFDPHTLLVVRPDIKLECLTTLEEKLLLARRYGGVSGTIVVHFTKELAGVSAAEFLDELRARFAIRALVVGSNFSFGHNRQGNVTFLRQYGQEHGIVVRAIELEEAERARISSTRIRSLVSEGQIIEANELLGHPVITNGIVVRGDQRGRQLGFPTANLVPQPQKLLPANGIYAARVYVGEMAKSDGSVNVAVVYDEARTVWKSAVSVGVRPHFDGQKRLVEAYLLDTELDLYGRLIIIEFVARLRGEQRFNSLDELIAQIASDVEQTRQLLSEEIKG